MNSNIGVATAEAPFIMLVLLLVHMLSDYLSHATNKKCATNTEEAEALQEMKRLLKEADAFSTPSTFAKAAKLRRAAAAKEKELLEIRQKFSKDKCFSSKLQVMAPRILKACIYLGFAWWFWDVPVAEVSTQLLQPFGNVISWRAKSTGNGLVVIGIIPWLLLATRVNAFISHKFILKPANRVKNKS